MVATRNGLVGLVVVSLVIEERKIVIVPVRNLDQHTEDEGVAALDQVENRGLASLGAALVSFREIRIVCNYPFFCAVTSSLFKRLFSVHGGYSQWSHWSQCSRSCNRGRQDRRRSCTSPLPVNGGRDCSGLGRARDSRTCNAHSCPGK